MSAYVTTVCYNGRMATITIYGASDDLVEIEGDISEEYYLGKNNARSVRVSDPETGVSMLVTARFHDQYEWLLAVSNDPASSTVQCPDWLVSLGERANYEGDPAVTITAPGELRVEKIASSDVIW